MARNGKKKRGRTRSAIRRKQKGMAHDDAKKKRAQQRKEPPHA